MRADKEPDGRRAMRRALPCLGDVLDKPDRRLIAQALQLLRHHRHAALRQARATQMHRCQQFDEQAFDLPQIRRLLDRCRKGV